MEIPSEKMWEIPQDLYQQDQVLPDLSRPCALYHWNASILEMSNIRIQMKSLVRQDFSD